MSRLEIGEPQLTNKQNKLFQPIFYKETTFANYKEELHDLSSNNCVLMDDLLRNQSTKTNHEASLAKKLDDEMGIEGDENQLREGYIADNVED
jgi:hypothetical protein